MFFITGGPLRCLFTGRTRLLVVSFLCGAIFLFLQGLALTGMGSAVFFAIHTSPKKITEYPHHLVEIHHSQQTAVSSTRERGFTEIPHHTQQPDEAMYDNENHEDGIPVWLLENPNYVPKQDSKHCHYLGIRPQGRLGNNMFAYSALWAISKKNYMLPVWSQFDLLRNYFHLEAFAVSNMDDLRVTDWAQLVEVGGNVYDDRTERLNYDLNIELVGFYQSWRYFSDFKADIRRQFRFREPILYLARNYLKASFEEAYTNTELLIDNITFVGIHVRRGDLLEAYNIERGYTVATSDYIDVAISFFESMYPEVLFIVCTDDLAWSKANVRRQVAPVVYAEDHYDVEDLAILSLCNHTVVSVGTFGWWAAWLSPGKVLYFADFPAKRSELAETFLHSDVFPPDWKGISFRD